MPSQNDDDVYERGMAAMFPPEVAAIVLSDGRMFVPAAGACRDHAGPTCAFDPHEPRKGCRFAALCGERMFVEAPAAPEPMDTAPCDGHELHTLRFASMRDARMYSAGACDWAGDGLAVRGIRIVPVPGGQTRYDLEIEDTMEG